jgi:hypothetical protein
LLIGSDRRRLRNEASRQKPTNTGITSPDFNPGASGPGIVSDRCYEDLHVPPIPEPLSFLCVFRFLRAYSPQSEDLRMIVGTRGGPVLFYQGDSVEFLQQAQAIACSVPEAGPAAFGLAGDCLASGEPVGSQWVASG